MINPKLRKEDFSTRYCSIFKYISPVKIEHLLQLLTEIDEFDLKAVNEVFLRLIFEKYDLSQGIDLIDEIRKVEEKGVYPKLISFKKVHAKHLIIGRYCALTKIKKLKEILQNSKKEDFDIPDPIAYASEFNRRQILRVVVLFDAFLMISMNKILAFNTMIKVGSSLIDTLSPEDVKTLTICLSSDQLEAQPVLNHILTLQGQSSGASVEHHMLGLLNFGNSNLTPSYGGRKNGPQKVGYGMTTQMTLRSRKRASSVHSDHYDGSKSQSSRPSFSFVAAGNKNQFNDITSLFEF